jgi:hypothetical protein
MRDWTTMRRSDFDAAEPLTLFDVAGVPAGNTPVKADKYGTTDLFAALEEE